MFLFFFLRLIEVQCVTDGLVVVLQSPDAPQPLGRSAGIAASASAAGTVALP